MKLRDLSLCWQQPNNTIQAANQKWPFPEKKYLLMWLGIVRNDSNQKLEKEYGNYEDRWAKKGCWNVEGCENE